MAVNVELLRKVRDQITAPLEAHPTLAWDQASWVREVDADDARAEAAENVVLPEGWCGTTYCIAGWACYLSGTKIGLVGDAVLTADGLPVEPHAADLLGLSEEDAERLFYTTENDIALEILDEILAEAARQAETAGVRGC